MSRGFSLVEVLVALLVLSVGLLGAACLLLGGLSDQSLALRQASATVLLADMADRIRANPAARGAYAGTMREDAPGCSEEDPCDAAALAAHDLAHFASAAQRLLPNQRPRTQIAFEPATGTTTDRYVISLTWIDARDSRASGEATLTLLVQPVAGGA
jgi:type IV pilus assembly protein PilV